MNKKRHAHALTIAGFDGSGGAGIQADLKAFSALGCYGMTVLTAIPVQNTSGVKSIYSIPSECVEDQLKAILEDIHIDALKIGMLHNLQIVLSIAKALRKYLPMKIVLDPVMVAKSGDALLSSEGVKAMKEHLLPIASLLTPNLPESSQLLEREIHTKTQMEQAAIDLTQMGPEAVIVKGGHLAHGPCDDCLCVRSPSPKIYWFSSPRIDTQNTHGTGCTFSAAVTAFLSRGYPMIEAINEAKKYTSLCIESGAEFTVGRGKHGPVHHFFSHW